MRLRSPEPGHDKLEFGVGSSRSDGTSGEQKIISVLVGRLVNKVRYLDFVAKVAASCSSADSLKSCHVIQVFGLG